MTNFLLSLEAFIDAKIEHATASGGSDLELTQDALNAARDQLAEWFQVLDRRLDGELL